MRLGQQQAPGLTQKTMDFLKNHYDHNVYTNSYICKHCGKTDNLKYLDTTNNLYLHISKDHNKKMTPQQRFLPAQFPMETEYNNIRSYQNKMTEYNYFVRDSQNSMFRYQQDSQTEQGYSDQWLDRLALSGFPIRDILMSIFSRYRENNHAYGVYLQNKALRLKDSIDRIKKFLNNKVPLLSHPNQIIDQIVQKFRISPHGARLVMQDFMLIYKNDYEVTDQLRRRGMTIYRYEQDRMNTVVFFCDEAMKINFSKFGDSVFVNFKKCFIKRYGDNRKTLIGTFTGQSTSIKHILFGTCLVLGESVKNYKILLKYFIKAMKMPYLPPSLIITDSDHLRKAIDSLSSQCRAYDSKAVISWYHLQEQLKCSLETADEEQRDYIIKKYMNVMSSLKQQQIQVLLEDSKLRELQKGRLTKLFNENKQDIMAYKSPIFVGFGIEKQHGKLLNQIISKFLDDLDTLGFFYIQSMKMFQHKMDIRTKQVELIRFEEFKAFQLPLSDELRYLSIRLEKPIFMKFLSMYKIAISDVKVIGKTLDNLNLYLIQNTGLNMKTFIYTVSYSLADQCWKCNCNLIFWSGLPCTHLIKVLRLCRGSITYYINRRWMIHNEKFNPNKINHPQQSKMQPQCDPEQVDIFQTKRVKIQQKQGQRGIPNQIIIDEHGIDEQEKQYLIMKENEGRVGGQLESVGDGRQDGEQSLGEFPDQNQENAIEQQVGNNSEICQPRSQNDENNEMI